MNARHVGTIVAMMWAMTLVVGCGGDGDGPAPSTTDRQLHDLISAAGISQLDPGPVPKAEKVTLGQALMFDKELSGNRDIACATCHHPLLHSADNLSLSLGTGGRGLGPARVRGVGRGLIPRNAPEVFNRGANAWRTMFWDIRVSGSLQSGFTTPAGAKLPAGLENILAVQAMFPVTSNDEMRGAQGENDVASIDPTDLPAIWAKLTQRLLAIPAYVAMFNAAFPDVPSNAIGFQHAANAIAAFEIAAFTFADSPWDRYVAGDESAMPDDAKNGAILFFGSAGCSKCHAGNLLTDQQAHDIGTPQLGPGKGSVAPQDYGNGMVTGSAANRYAFRTPPLRNVALTGPWMHAGAFTTLRGAVEHELDPAMSLRHYDPTQLAPEVRDTYLGDEATITAILGNLDTNVQTPKHLSAQQIDQLVSFLEALTDPAAADLSGVIPTSVPSGLPVYD